MKIGGLILVSAAASVVSLDKKLYSTLSLLIQVYKWVPIVDHSAGRGEGGGGGGNLAMD